MKNILFAIALFLLPSSAMAATITVPWVATSTGSHQISPGQINGVPQEIRVTNLQTSSSTRTSTFAGKVGVGTTSADSKLNVYKFIAADILPPTFAVSGAGASGSNYPSGTVITIRAYSFTGSGSSRSFSSTYNEYQYTTQYDGDAPYIESGTIYGDGAYLERSLNGKGFTDGIFWAGSNYDYGSGWSGPAIHLPSFAMNTRVIYDDGITLWGMHTEGGGYFGNPVGIGTTTPQGSLDVVGSTSIRTLVAANCDVFSDSNGGLYCGVNGNPLWTVIKGAIYNATTSEVVIIGRNATTTNSKLEVVGTTTAFNFIASTTATSVFPNASTTNISVATNLYTSLGSGCLQSSGGLVTSTLANCGTGTASLTFLVLNGFIYQATSSDSTSFGTTTPFAKVSIQGTRGSLLPVFAVASSTTATGATSSLFIILPNGNVGIGSSTPTSALVVNGTTTSNIYVATSTTATSTLVNATIDNVELGNARFDQNAGAVAAFDMDITSSAANNTIESYSYRLDAANILTVYSRSDGAGSIKDSAILIGTTTPTSPGDKVVIVANATTTIVSALKIASSSGATVLSVDGGGRIVTGGGTPAVSTCGSSPSISGNDTAGTVTVGSGTVTACTLTFSTALAGTPKFVGVTTGGGVNVASGYSAKSSTAVTFSFASTVGGGTFDYFIVQ